MPALSPTMEKGTLAKWYKKEGDTIKAGDVIADVETDKATVAFEATEPGIVAKILVPAGKEVPLGAIVAILVEEQSQVAAFKDFVLEVCL
jgi:pyruvate dehydrogenase E2 component (dihydrolipoamide acetyltransferase)